ncbi:MAG TPA: hypothetical protein VK760_16390 [Candidatus Acidoferrales bacterium]|jgi:cytochrome P450|nr:hypothetical protein [Candidatus Acidoferrales bacterium]
MKQELTPITAVTAPDPYTYYSRLVDERPFGFDARVGAWVAASAGAVECVLESSAFRVRPPAEPIPPAMIGTPLGEVFGRLARMNDGPRHASLASTAAGLLARWTSRDVAAVAKAAALRLAGAVVRGESDIGAYAQLVPATTVAGLLAIDRADAAMLVAHFAAAIAPGASAGDIARGVEAAAVLKTSLPLALDDDAAANALGFLFQSYDATAAAIATTLARLAGDDALCASTRGDERALDALLAKTIRDDPPVHNTRRFAAADTRVCGESVGAGDSVFVLLAAANRDPRAERSYAFGFGPHACPGSSVATIVASAGVGAMLDGGLDLSRVVVGGYRPSANVRMPLLATVTQ